MDASEPRSASSQLWMFKRDPSTLADLDTKLDRDEEETFERIRCPLCEWRPSASCRWCCLRVDTPEPFFVGCATVWNTFLTRGRCPGCTHQWQWTSCLRCEGWSLHEDWYEEPTPD